MCPSVHSYPQADAQACVLSRRTRDPYTGQSGLCTGVWGQSGPLLGTGTSGWWTYPQALWTTVGMAALSVRLVHKSPQTLCVRRGRSGGVNTCLVGAGTCRRSRAGLGVGRSQRCRIRGIPGVRRIVRWSAGRLWLTHRMARSRAHRAGGVLLLGEDVRDGQPVVGGRRSAVDGARTGLSRPWQGSLCPAKCPETPRSVIEDGAPPHPMSTRCQRATYDAVERVSPGAAA